MSKSTTIDYEFLMQESMRNVMKEALSLTAKEGLPGKHHFYISFKTDYPGVDVPDYLRDEFPDDITIVLQHEFWDLEVNEENFYITLCFNDVHERIAVPFGAVVSFVDPHVKFGMHFSPAPLPAEPESIMERVEKKSRLKKVTIAVEDTPEDQEKGSSNVINFESFKRK